MTRESLRRLAQAALAIVGLGLIAYFVRDAGPERVARVLLGSAEWLPVIVGFGIVQATSDVLALRNLLGEVGGRVPRVAWVRTSAVAYAMTILLPAGRAAGEVTRGALLSAYVGGAPAATAAARLQASYLLANGVISIAAWLAVASGAGFGSTLSLLLAANTLLLALVAVGILALLRGDRAGRSIEKIRARLSTRSNDAPLDPELRRRFPWRAAAICTAGRVAQVAQYAAFLAAVGGIPSVRGALIALGIHIIGATAGDMVPNQLGAVDGAYRAFAPALGLASDPAKALSIAFVGHAAQLVCGAGAILLAVLTRGVTAAAPREAPAPAGADARS